MERLALDRFSSPWLRNQHLARYRFAAGFARGARVLDAACGSGYGSRILREAGAGALCSLDVSPEAFADAARVAMAGPGALLADVTRLPFRSGAFDLYASFETLEHVEDDEALLAEARRVLATGGRFVCSTPNRELLSPGNRLSDRPENPYHVREYSIAEFEQILRGHFRQVTMLGQTWFSEGHARRLARAGSWSNHLAVRLHQLRNVAGLAWERPSRHDPVPLGEGEGRPEVAIGLCRA